MVLEGEVRPLGCDLYCAHTHKYDSTVTRQIVGVDYDCPSAACLSTTVQTHIWTYTCHKTQRWSSYMLCLQAYIIGKFARNHRWYLTTAAIYWSPNRVFLIPMAIYEHQVYAKVLFISDHNEHFFITQSCRHICRQFWLSEIGDFDIFHKIRKLFSKEQWFAI